MAVPLKPRAILVDVIPPSLDHRTAERRLRELEALTTTYGGIVVVKVVQRRSLPHYRTYIGSGKLTELIETAKKEHVDLLILNQALKPRQMFAIEEELRPHKLRAWDRTDLILKIFDRHARTAEAKLQVKLAAIRHMGPRIYGMGLELMRQSGGIGGRGGQGESNTEVMKRHLAEQEKHIERDLERMAATRAQHRKHRDRIGMKTVSVVGYTNAGKSSLVAALSGKKVHIEDALFATLDTRVGKLSPNILISDTIGFIQDLPAPLLKAFRSTLDETVDADLLLHVIDAADEHLASKVWEVQDVLTSIGAGRIPTFFVFNKCDIIAPDTRDELLATYAEHQPIAVSSVSGEGLPALKSQIERALSSHGTPHEPVPKR